MSHLRALIVLELEKDPAPSLALLGQVAPRLEHLLVVAELSTAPFAWIFGERSLLPDEATTEVAPALRALALEVAPSVDLRVVPQLSGDALGALCSAEPLDLLAFDTRSLRNAWVATAERKRQRAAVLWCEGPPPTRPLREIACVGFDERSRAELAVFLRDVAEPSTHVSVLSRTPLAPDDLATTLQVSGVRATVEVSGLRDAPQAWLDEYTRERRIDLLVFSRISTALLVSALRAAPVLLLPPDSAPRPDGQRAIDVPDLVDDGGPIRVRVDHPATVGDLKPIPDQALAFVSGGRVVATLCTRDGEAQLPKGLALGSVGVYRASVSAPAEPLAAVEQEVAVIAPGTDPIALVDAELPDATLRAVEDGVATSGGALLAVRLRPTRSCRAIRERLRALELPARVLDARLVLDEGEAIDVSPEFDPVRLARVAATLHRSGFPITAVAQGEQVEPWSDDSAASPATQTGNRIELELDNAQARRWLLDAIAGSKKTLHLQVYMALDDETGATVEGALAAAAARGVAVRVLVDSLHGLHGSFGTKNPLLERLAARPGVQLRTHRPITELPSLADLKARDHRKLVVADGRLALLGGRNLSHEYYSGFDEVPITPESNWRAVPWLDAGARVEGPAVAALEGSFLEAWLEAGGAPFPVLTPEPAGPSAARVVVHRALQDAFTLETYLELVASAKSHLYLVNGFPLVLELQHALLRALDRGVRVRFLVGSATPTYEGQPFSGSWSTARQAAMELTHSRLDPLVAAGGEVYLFALRDVPGWAPELGLVHPHVHAKVMSADGLRCALGSANMDITASYWESELLLVTEDPALAAGLEAQLDLVMAGSTRVSSDDPAWRALAERRAWMRYWPGVLSA